MANLVAEMQVATCITARWTPFTLDSDILLDLGTPSQHRADQAHLENLGYALRDGQPGLYQAPNVPIEAKRPAESTSSFQTLKL